MKLFSKFLFLTVAPVLFINSVWKSPEHCNIKTSELIIEFDNVVGKQDLKLDTANYVNAAGEQFTVSQLQYFISNIQFRRTDGTMFVIDQDKSYFLVQENNPSSQKIELKIPPGNYDQLIFILGVDSLRNTMDISKRTGVLDPANSLDNGMYWSWNSGYIFLKMEGISPAAPVDPTGEHKFRYHIGGFGGYSAKTINNIKTIHLDLPGKGLLLQPGKKEKAKILIKADILKVFNGAMNLKIAEHSNIMFNEYSIHVADNYSNMFRCDNIEN